MARPIRLHTLITVGRFDRGSDAPDRVPVRVQS
jgi:hypothetical protein